MSNTIKKGKIIKKDIIVKLSIDVNLHKYEDGETTYGYCFANMTNKNRPKEISSGGGSYNDTNTIVEDIKNELEAILEDLHNA